LLYAIDSLYGHWSGCIKNEHLTYLKFKLHEQLLSTQQLHFIDPLGRKIAW